MPIDLLKSLVKQKLLWEQNFTLMTTLYNPSSWCTDSRIVDLIKGACKDEHSHFMTKYKSYVYPNQLS